jgi:hypothetical protein
MMRQDKYAFEDEGTIFFRTKERGEIRITKEQQEAIDALLEKYGPYEITDSDYDQGGGSSSSSQSQAAGTDFPCFSEPRPTHSNARHADVAAGPSLERDQRGS